MSDDTHSILARAGLDRDETEAVVAAALVGAEDGELYLEYAQSEGLVFDNGRLSGASYDTRQGFGLRAVSGEAVGYAHSGEITRSKETPETQEAMLARYRGALF